MLKQVILLTFFTLGWAWTNAQDQETTNAIRYHYKIDLNKAKNDKLKVELTISGNLEKAIKFHLPKMVPGTYSVYDFGRFVSDFEALDANGKALESSHPDPNTWKIQGADQLKTIRYWVEDTWDTSLPNVIFEPAGTSIEKDVFVFNNHGIFGYIQGQERQPFTIEVDRPERFFGGTALKRTGGDADTDIFKCSSYNELVDSPIMFAEPDTAKFKVGNADILIHTYSPTKRVKSKDLVKDIQPILEAQRTYLGNKLPVDHYAFIIYLNEENKAYLSQAAGALEHSYSSFYCLFEGESSAIAQMVRDVAAHEFFHIVTPLSIHSEEIHYFDFINPKMSEHLWLYEGVTEYSAQHVQIKQGLMPLEQFLDVTSTKMSTADIYNQNLSFTEMSKTCLDENKSQYNNVYAKGALIGLCIDLKLRILSEGNYGIQDLMQDLSESYGIDKPFKDKDLFDKIVEVTGQKEIGVFLDKHVAGTEPLPMEELMKAAGIEYKASGKAKQLSIFGFDPQTGIDFHFGKSMLKVVGAGLDQFGKDYIKFQDGDLLYKWNGTELTLSNINMVLGSYDATAKENDELTITVLRKVEEPKKSKKKKRNKKKRKKKGKSGVDEDGYMEVELKTTLQKIEVDAKHIFIPKENPTEEEMLIRKSWLGEYKD
ncbi:MAG: peptidase M61 [Saprospiraceae bacterium]|nr:peptidase M61 [Saprospiraceae bacterium]